MSISILIIGELSYIPVPEFEMEANVSHRPRGFQVPASDEPDGNPA